MNPRRCPDPRKPCAVIYDRERDRLDIPDDSVSSLETDEGPILLSGMRWTIFLFEAMKITQRYLQVR